MDIPKKTRDSWKKALVQSKKEFIEKFNLEPGHRVLVLCCGIGGEALLSREIVGDTGYIMGIDINQKAINLANQAKGRYGYDNVDFIVGDVQYLEKHFNEFDRVCCLFGMHFFNYQSSILDYWSNCLIPNGTLGILEWLKSYPSKEIDGVLNIVQKHLPTDSPNKVTPSTYNKKNDAIWSSIEKSNLEYNIYYPDLETYWGIFKQNELYSKLTNDIGQTNLVRMEDEVLQHIKALPVRSFEEITRTRIVFAHKSEE